MADRTSTGIDRRHGHRMSGAVALLATAALALTSGLLGAAPATAATPTPTGTPAPAASAAPAPGAPVPTPTASAPAPAVAAAPAPAPFTRAPNPTILGAARVGLTLTAKPGAWSPGTPTFTYQWSVDGTPVVGETRATYVALPSDLGKTIGVSVTAALDGYVTTTRTTTGTAKVVAGTVSPTIPGIIGDPSVGSTVTAVPGLWTPSTLTFGYQWYAASVAVAGATAKQYVVAPGDVGKKLTVTVTGGAPGYPTTVRTSIPSTTVTAEASEPAYGTGKITGTVFGEGSPKVALNGATVVLYRGDFPVPTDSTQTANGRFSFSGVDPGEYTLYVDGTWNGERSSSYYGGTHSLVTATTFVVVKGRTAAVTFSVVRGASFSGYLTAPAELRADLALGSLSVQPDDGSVFLNVPVIEPSGRFTVSDLDPGTYRVLYQARGENSPFLDSWFSGASSYELATPITITQPRQHLEVGDWAMRVGASISGTVLDEAGKPAPEVYVELWEVGENINVFNKHMRTTSTGYFTLRGLPAGSYQVRLWRAPADGGPTEWIGGVARANARVFTVTPGQVLTLPSVKLAATGSLALKLSAPGGAAPRTDGTYRATFLSGDEDVRFDTGRTATTTLTTLLPGRWQVDYFVYEKNQSIVAATRMVTVSANRTTSVTLPVGPAPAP